MSYQQMPPPAGGYGAPMPRGPLGKPRSIGACIFIAIITLGIYTFVWTWKTHGEIKDHSGQGVGGPLGFIIYLVISPVTYFLLPSEVGKMVTMSGQQSKVKGVTGFWIILPLLGTIIWFVKVQGQLNRYWRSLGAQG